jgi:uncharacterized membrane protein YoaK (UPF0700 family)
MTGRRAVLAIAMLLAGTAGAADAVAFFGLGGAFGGIVTGNLVTAGYGIAAGRWALVRPTATAVAACVAGELLWARLLRRPRAANWLLLTELTLFLLVLVGWMATGSHPRGSAALALLALISVALGSQSIWALRIHQTTTYFTGMLTKTISTAATGPGAGAGASARQLAALLAGAMLSGAALHWLRPAAPVVPLSLLGAATILHLRVTRAGGSGAGRERHGS